MAVQNDPRLYSAGAVTFDATPSTNLYAQLMAKRQAKDEAIDEYYRKLPSTLNKEGIRNQDREGFDKEIVKIQQYWIQNKDKIKKGNTPEAFTLEQMFRDMENAGQRSKNAGKTDLELGKMRFSKENGYIFKDKSFIDKLSQHGLSVFDPNHKGIDLGTVAIPTKPFDIKDQEEYYKSIITGMEAGKKYDYSKSYTNPQTGQVIVPTIDVLNDDQIAKAAKKAMELVAVDDSKQAYFEDLLHSPKKEDWDILNAAYKKYFKGDVDTPEKAAAADAIIKLSVPKKYAEEQEVNYQQKQQDKQININLNQGRGSGSGGSGGTIDGNEFDRIPIPKKTWLNKGDRVKPEDIPSSTKAILKTAGIDIEGMEYFMIDVNDGQVQSITPYWKDKDGKVHKEGVITRTDMENAQLRYNSEPQKGKQPNFGEQNRTPKSNSKPTYRGLDKNGNPIFK